MTSAAVAFQDTAPRPGAERATQAWARALQLSAALAARPERTLGVVLDELADHFGEAPALISSAYAHSFDALAARARRYTRWAQAQGYGRGDVVALLAPNAPDYFAAWVGVSRAGATVALLNTHLEDRALAHTFKLAEAKAVLLAPTLERAYAGAASHLANAPEVWRLEPSKGLALEAYDDGPLRAEEIEGFFNY